MVNRELATCIGDDGPEDISKADLKRLGELEIRLYFVRATAPPVAENKHPFLPGQRSIHEKSLKGRAISSKAV